MCCSSFFLFDLTFRSGAVEQLHLSTAEAWEGNEFGKPSSRTVTNHNILLLLRSLTALFPFFQYPSQWGTTSPPRPPTEIPPHIKQSLQEMTSPHHKPLCAGLVHCGFTSIPAGAQVWGVASAVWVGAVFCITLLSLCVSEGFNYSTSTTIVHPVNTVMVGGVDVVLWLYQTMFPTVPAFAIHL